MNFITLGDPLKDLFLDIFFKRRIADLLVQRRRQDLANV